MPQIIQNVRPCLRIISEVTPSLFVNPIISWVTRDNQKLVYFLVNSSRLYVLSWKFISHITLTFRFNLMSHAKYIVLCGVSHLVIYFIWGITCVWCFISRITLVDDSNLLCHTLSFVASLYKFWRFGSALVTKRMWYLPQIIFITRCDTPHRTIYLAWLVRLNLKVSLIREMNLQESTYRQDEFTRKYTSFWLSNLTQEMMGLTNKLGVTSEIKQRQGLTFWIIWGVFSD